MIKVLVTGVGSLIGQGIVKSIKKSSIKYRIFGTDYFSSAVGLYWVDRGYILPDILKSDISEKVWLDYFCKILIDNHIDIVLPGLDFEIPLLAKYKSLIEKKTQSKVVVSSENVVNIANDKWKTVEYLKQNSFEYPKSTLPENIEEFMTLCDYPYIVKPRFGHTSENVFLVKNNSELRDALKRCDMPIVQEYLNKVDMEYTCGAVYMNEKVISVISLRRILKNGNTQIAFSEQADEINKYITKITNKIKPTGPINFQLRMTDNGPVIFEINPRFSGTTPIREIFGINEVEATIESILNYEIKIKQPIKKGVVIRYFEDQYIPLVEYEKFIE